MTLLCSFLEVFLLRTLLYAVRLLSREHSLSLRIYKAFSLPVTYRKKHNLLSLGRLAGGYPPAPPFIVSMLK